MDTLAVIQKFYPPDTRLYQTLVNHSRQVARKSLEIADGIDQQPDRDFLENAAMLHDIGIFLTRARSIGCFGNDPYIRHGILGRQILEDEGLPIQYGLVCERHTGAGITRENIIANDLPLPHRDMVPVSLEEKIICVADKYFSKSPDQQDHPVTTIQVIQNLEKIHIEHAKRFSVWAQELGLIRV